MAKRHRERCSISLTIREMEISTTMRYHLISVRIATIKKQKIKNGEDMKKFEPLYTVGGNVKWYIYYGKHYSSFSKIKNRITI